MFLQGVTESELFKDLDKRSLKFLLRNMEPLICKRNEKIYKKYEKAEDFFIVIKGEIEVYN